MLWHEDGRDWLVPQATLVIEEGRIAGLLRQLPAEPDGEVLDGSGTLALPGFINAHTHAFLGSFFRGITDDFNREQYGGSALYALLFPLMDLADELLTPEQQAVLIKVGLVEMLKSGCTTVCESTTGSLDLYPDLNRELGLRLVLSPNFKSTALPKAAADGTIAYTEHAADELAPLRENVDFYRRHHNTQRGLFHVRLGPHAPDTCSPALLAETAKMAAELDTTVSIHLAQSRVEDDAIRRQHGCSPVQFLHRTGLLSERLTAGHCVFTDETDLELMAASGMTVAHCPLVFAKGGIQAPSWKYVERGVNVTIGTDSYTLDMVQELRAATLLGKLASGAAHKMNAPLALQLATVNGARALGRSDLGRLAPGMQADVVLIDMQGVHMGPVYDPIRTFVYNASAADVRDVIVAGSVRVRDRQVVGLDEQAMMRAAEAAAREAWAVAEQRGILPSPYALPPSLNV